MGMVESMHGGKVTSYRNGILKMEENIPGQDVKNTVLTNLPKNLDISEGNMINFYQKDSGNNGNPSGYDFIEIHNLNEVREGAALKEVKIHKNDDGKWEEIVPPREKQDEMPFILEALRKRAKQNNF